MSRLMTLSILIAPEYPFGSGVMSAMSFVLSKVRPFSSENVQSSAKYSVQGVLSPVTNESYNCCVRRTSSSWVTGGVAACTEVQDKIETARERKRRRIKLLLLILFSLSECQKPEK